MDREAALLGRNPRVDGGSMDGDGKSSACIWRSSPGQSDVHRADVWTHQITDCCGIGSLGCSGGAVSENGRLRHVEGTRGWGARRHEGARVAYALEGR